MKEKVSESIIADQWLRVHHSGEACQDSHWNSNQEGWDVPVYNEQE